MPTCLVSHQVGKPAKMRRDVLVKFTSYRYKHLIMRASSGLTNKDAARLGLSPAGATRQPESAANAAYITDNEFGKPEVVHKTCLANVRQIFARRESTDDEQLIPGWAGLVSLSGEGFVPDEKLCHR